MLQQKPRSLSHRIRLYTGKAGIHEKKNHFCSSCGSNHGPSPQKVVSKSSRPAPVEVTLLEYWVYIEVLKLIKDPTTT